MRNDERQIEAASLINDYVKHINTLSTASLLLLVTFLEKLFQTPQSKWLVGLSLVSFLLSVIGGVAFKTVNTFQIYEKIPDDELNDFSVFIAKFGMILFWLGFLVGITAIATFGLANLFNEA